MNDTTTQPQSTIQSIPVGETSGRQIIDIINGLARSTKPLRMFPGLLDTEIITAAITFAGCIHGELIAMGLMDEGSDETPEQVKLLTHNYAAGVEAGKAKVAEVKAKQVERGEEPTGFQGPSIEVIFEGMTRDEPKGANDK